MDILPIVEYSISFSKTKNIKKKVKFSLVTKILQTGIYKMGLYGFSFAWNGIMFMSDLLRKRNYYF